MEGIIRKVSMKTQVYQYLRRLILFQEYRPGQRINLDELCRTLKVSNTPIREAIGMLEKEGLVVSTPNAGFSVMTPTRKQFFDTAQATIFLLNEAYDFCRAQGLMGTVLAHMEETLAKQRMLTQAGEWVSYVETSAEFERHLIEATGNEILLRYFREMETMRAFISSYYSNREPEILKLFFSQHEEIWRLMKEEKVDEVKVLLQEHFYKPGLIPEELPEQ